MTKNIPCTVKDGGSWPCRDERDTHLEGTNSSSRPSAKTAYSFGPSRRSERMVNTTLSLIRLSNCLWG